MSFIHYQQHDAMDCGPTCLRMVAKHYGRGLSIQKLREATQIGKEGVSLLGADGKLSVRLPRALVSSHWQ
jgi:ATP-binding cassette subfamily B protein